MPRNTTKVIDFHDARARAESIVELAKTKTVEQCGDENPEVTLWIVALWLVEAQTGISPGYLRLPMQVATKMPKVPGAPL